MVESLTPMITLLVPAAVGVPEMAPEELDAEAGGQSRSRPGVRQRAAAGGHCRRIGCARIAAG